MMRVPERETITDRSQQRYICGLTARDIFSVLSTLILPMMLGIFTVILTFEQKAEGARQRMEDRRLATEQREQDLNISRDQRREDRELAREQREQDLNISILQRELDKLNAKNQREDDQLRRELDLGLARNKSVQDDQLAEKARNLSSDQRAHELAIEEVRHRDSLLEKYMDDMGRILEQNNGTLTSNPLTATLVRLKTLTLVRRLDPSRNSQVIRFLHEAGQLTNGKSPLDLSDAELNGIDLSSPRQGTRMNALHFVQAYLTDSSFANRDLSRSNFSGSIMHGVNFSSTVVEDIDFGRAKFSGPSPWHGAILTRLNFTEAEFEHFDFNAALKPTTSMNLINFSAVQFQSVSFARLALRKVTFQHGYDITWVNVDFTETALLESGFQHIELVGWNFTRTFCDQCTFVQCIFTDSVFDNTSFINSNFYGWSIASSRISYNSWLNNNQFNSIDFRNNRFDHLVVVNAYFGGGEIEDCQFSYVDIKRTQFYKITVLATVFLEADWSEQVEFIQCHLESTTFSPRAQLQTISFRQSTLLYGDMSQSNLTKASFFFTHLESVNFSQADLRGASLAQSELISCNLTGAPVTDAQLAYALSLNDTILPNGTRHRDTPLLRNGHANCTVPLNQSWTVEQGAISVKQKTATDCSFIRASHSGNSSIISQRVNIARYGPAIKEKLVVFSIEADCSNVKINLIERLRSNGTRFAEWKDITPDGQPWLFKNKNTNELEIRLYFDGTSHAECDDLQLSIRLYLQWSNRKRKVLYKSNSYLEACLNSLMLRFENLWAGSNMNTTDWRKNFPISTSWTNIVVFHWSNFSVFSMFLSQLFQYPFLVGQCFPAAQRWKNYFHLAQTPKKHCQDRRNRWCSIQHRQALQTDWIRIFQRLVHPDRWRILTSWRSYCFRPRDRHRGWLHWWYLFSHSAVW